MLKSYLTQLRIHGVENPIYLNLSMTDKLYQKRLIQFWQVPSSNQYRTNDMSKNWLSMKVKFDKGLYAWKSCNNSLRGIWITGRNTVEQKDLLVSYNNRPPRWNLISKYQIQILVNYKGLNQSHKKECWTNKVLKLIRSRSKDNLSNSTSKYKKEQKGLKRN